MTVKKIMKGTEMLGIISLLANNKAFCFRYILFFELWSECPLE